MPTTDLTKIADAGQLADLIEAATGCRNACKRLAEAGAAASSAQDALAVAQAAKDGTHNRATRRASGAGVTLPADLSDLVVERDAKGAAVAFHTGQEAADYLAADAAKQ